ncbi:MAG: hypothetical protein KGI38_04480 [Thaumarchaeota archaeon]|nr:hypothetical protein [Nitrososphaerota archaeon]
MRRAKSSRKLGKLLFFIPVLALLVLVVFALVTYVAFESGTLTVVTYSSGRYSPSFQLHATVTVGATTETSPFNFSLSQGHYTVVFGQLTWYVTPPPRAITLTGGGTEYAVGTYNPIVRVVAITQDGFNSSSVSALHGVTPVVWKNEGSSSVTFEISGVTRIPLAPGQNYTKVFAAAGTFNFDIVNTSFKGTVSSV